MWVCSGMMQVFYRQICRLRRKKSYGNSGFVFNGDLFKNDFVPENAYNLDDCAYLTDEDIPNVSDTAEPVSKKRLFGI